MRHLIAITIILSFLSHQAYALVIDADKAVEIALENSEELTIADNVVSQAQLNRNIARTAYLPNFSGNITAAWQLPDKQYDMGMTLRMKGVYLAGINLTQPIFTGGKIIAANRLAGIGKKAADEQHRLTRLNVMANALTSYWSYVAVIAKKAMMESYRTFVDTAYYQTETAVEVGMATKNELLRIDARRSQVIYQQEQVVNGSELCRMALCNALNIPLDTEIEVADNAVATDIPEDLEHYDITNRPEYQLLQADIDAKRQEMRMIRADFLPQIGLQAGWSAFGNLKFEMMQQLSDGSYMPIRSNIGSQGWSILLSMQVPLFHWGEGYKKVKHARLDIQNAQLTLSDKTKKLDLQVKQAITNIFTGKQLVVSAETAVRQAETALLSTQQAYSIGMARVTDLLDAQAQWYTARASLIEAHTQLQISIVDYRVATATM